MGIISKHAEITIGSKNKKKYEQLGYGELRVGEKISVLVEHLPKFAKTKVLVECDRCKTNTMMVEYGNYNSVIKKTGSYCCIECGRIKQKETLIRKYGVINYSQTPEWNEKVKKHNQELYGVDYYSQTDECKNKVAQTNLEKYGYKTILETPDFIEKMKQQNLEKYGYEYFLQVPEVRKRIEKTNYDKYGVNTPTKNDYVKEKIKNTFMERYGGDCSSHVPEIQEKIMASMCKNGNCPSSTQQRYICDLYNGTLNYPIGRFGADILVNNIDVEYSGSGHNLNIKFGSKTEEEFQKYEIIRDNIIKREGYKIMEIISHTDKLPSDEILLQMLSETRQYFSIYPNHSWREWHIDDGIYRDAEHKEGEPYDYGELNTIKKTDAESVA